MGKRLLIHIAICCFLLFVNGLLTMFQFAQSINIFLFNSDSESGLYYAVALPGTSEKEVVSALGEPHETVHFEGVRMSDQRGYDKLLIYEVVPIEVHYYLQKGEISFAALLVYSPIPLSSVYERLVWVVFSVITLFLILILIFLSKAEIPLSQALLLTIHGIVSALLVSNPYRSLSTWTMWFSLSITITLVIIWFISLAGFIKMLIKFTSQSYIEIGAQTGDG